MLPRIIAAATLLTAASAACIEQPSGTTSSTPPSASPTGIPQLPVGTKFSLMALRSASPIHFASAGAAAGSLFLKLPDQNAECEGEDPGVATFYLDEAGAIFLYTGSGEPQQLYADRSGMGQGKLGYTTGDQQPPRNGEQTGFQLDESNNLSLRGAEFLACPNSIDGAWSLWVYTGVSQPGGNADCLGLTARAVEISEPTACEYTTTL